jgi:DNA-binding LacI/PurR family transcriptional regulator
VPGINEVAILAGVSTATVSRALSGKGQEEFVTNELRDIK